MSQNFCMIVIFRHVASPCFRYVSNPSAPGIILNVVDAGNPTSDRRRATDPRGLGRREKEFVLPIAVTSAVWEALADVSKLGWGG
jgi:hypothetical protein